MMKINNISMNSTNQITSPKISTATKECKNLETELANKQQRLNKLTSTKDMSAEEAQKERMKIQREIAQLNRKLRLERLEEAQEAKENAQKQDKKKVITEEMFKEVNSKEQTSAKEKEEAPSQAKADAENEAEKKKELVTLKNLIVSSAMAKELAIKQNSFDRLEGQKNILYAEIKADTLYGTDPSFKKEELAQLEKTEKRQVEVLDSQPKQTADKSKSSPKIVIRE